MPTNCGVPNSFQLVKLSTTEAMIGITRNSTMPMRPGSRKKKAVRPSRLSRRLPQRERGRLLVAAVTSFIAVMGSSLPALEWTRPILGASRALRA
ncbi:hypothetical protein D3C87_1633470 [compost metagenome]